MVNLLVEQLSDEKARIAYPESSTGSRVCSSGVRRNWVIHMIFCLLTRSWRGSLGLKYPWWVGTNQMKTPVLQRQQGTETDWLYLYNAHNLEITDMCFRRTRPKPCEKLRICAASFSRQWHWPRHETSIFSIVFWLDLLKQSCSIKHCREALRACFEFEGRIDPLCGQQFAGQCGAPSCSALDVVYLKASTLMECQRPEAMQCKPGLTDFTQFCAANCG